MRLRLWLVLSLVLIIGLPSNAIAEEYRTETRQEIVSESISSDNLLGATGEPTPLALIKSIIMQRIEVFGKSWYWYKANVLLRLVIGNADQSKTYLLLVVAMVFGWWGVRKVIRMIFRAFRKGKMNV